MLKNEIIQAIREEVESVSCEIVKIYGVGCGVGYNLEVDITYKNDNIDTLKAKAIGKSWACVGWVRENEQGFNLYKGGNNEYQYIDGVKNYWENGEGFEKYLNRFKKQDLINFLRRVKNEI